MKKVWKVREEVKESGRIERTNESKRQEEQERGKKERNKGKDRKRKI